MRRYARAMASDRSPRRRGIPQRLARAGRKAVAALGLLGLLLPCQAEADWLGKLVGAAQRMAPAPNRSSKALDSLAAHVKTLPTKAEATVLAAEATPEGHWRFVNRAGETITAGTPAEMQRVVLLLVPDAKPEARLTLYLTEDTVFARRTALKDLPRGTELNMRVGGESYRILRRPEGAGERLFAEIRANLVVELADQIAFAEAAWQLARPLNKASIRILALEPGGAPRLPSSPRIDPASQKALIDSIDPASLSAALGAVRGQTVLVTGRIDGELLHFKQSSGPDRSLLVKDLLRAADAADVNLILLHASSTPRQPGGRNWLWQKVEVKGLEEALQRARVADFYNALAPPNGRFAVSARPSGIQRTVLEIGAVADLPKPPASRPIADILSDAVSGLTGRVITTGVQAHVRSAEHQRDVDWRLIASVPAHLQISYVLLVLAGLFGVPASRLWWGRLWPPENAAEYAGPGGYWAARLVRGLAFVAIFLPLTAPLSAPLTLGRQIWDTVTAPIRWWRRLLGRPPRKPTANPTSGSPADVGSGPGARGALGSAAASRTTPATSGLGSYRPSR
jgi:hypothetical protein